MRKFTGNNQGVALITVIIGVMFCLLLTSTMLRVSLLGLQSRSINNQVSDTFYDSENVVDTIRLNLQNTAAKAWATSSGNSATTSKPFVAKVYELITEKTYPETGSLSLSSSEKQTAIAKLTANAIQGGTVTDIGDIVRFTGDTGKLEGITIKGVEVKYENPKTKMVSYVKTDITIRAPLYASKKKYPLASYSMFAGSGASLWNTNSYGGQYGNPNQCGFLEQEGNVYIGYAGDGIAVNVSNRETFILSGGNVVINGNIVVSNYSNLQLTADDVEVRGTITLADNNCHLIIGTATNLKCQDIIIGGESVADGEYTLTSGGAIYYGTPYRCYTTWMKPDGNAKQGVGSLNNGTWHAQGETTPGYYTSDGTTYYPNYMKNASSIVYIDSTNLTSSYAYDAYVYGKSDIRMQNGATKLTITTDPDDSELKRRPRRNTQRVVTESDNGGYKSTHGKYYDDYFLEIIDLEYFEGFMYDEYDTTRNCPVNNRIKSSIYDPDSEKNEPESADSFEGTTIKKQKKTDDEGNALPDNSDEEFPSVTYSGIDYSYTSYDGSTKKYKNPRVAVVFTGNDNSGCGNLVHSSDRPFVVSHYDVTFHVDKNDADYTGIIFTSESVSLKKDNGYCSGKSLLNLDTNPNLTNLKALMDTIGAHMSSSGVTNKKYVIFNNLFNGGIKRFYEKPTSGNSNYQIDVTHNKNMDLVDTNNFEKK